MLSKSLKTFVILWEVIVVSVMTYCFISIWYFLGFHKVWEVFNPLSYSNSIISLLVFSPSIAANMLLKRLV